MDWSESDARGDILWSGSPQPLEAEKSTTPIVPIGQGMINPQGMRPPMRRTGSVYGASDVTGTTDKPQSSLPME